MMIRNSLPLSFQFSAFKTKQSFNENTSAHLTAITPLTNSLHERNKAIEIIYRAQAHLRFSRSTHYLAIGILDKLILRGFPLSKNNFELVSGSLLLVCTKFNEVYPASVRKLNKVIGVNYQTGQYAMMEGQMLELLDFNIFLEDGLYFDLAQLESNYSHQQNNTCQEIIKTAILNPSQTFRNGSRSLIMAIQSSMNGLSHSERYSNSRTLHRQTMEIRNELNRLHSFNFGFSTTPCRA